MSETEYQGHEHFGRAVLYGHSGGGGLSVGAQVRPEVKVPGGGPFFLNVYPGR